MQNSVSVIIPVYNSEKYLKRTLNSLKNQTFKNFEIICINDCSTDNSLKILTEFQDRRLKIINNEQNLGAALSRNRGLELSRGKYIYFLDSDDYIDEKYLEVMVQKAEQTKADIILNLSVFSQTNGVETQYFHPSLPVIKTDGEYLDNISVIHNAPCFIWARLYRKSFLDKYELKFPDIQTAEDVAFNTISAIQTNKNYLFYGEKYHYSVNQSGLTGTVTIDNNRDLQHIKAYSLIYDYLKEHNLSFDSLKLFRVYPFFKVDSKEKFNSYKEFFVKIKDDFLKCENIYNDLEKYFAFSVLNSQNYDDYLKNYNPVVTIGFLRKRK